MKIKKPSFRYASVMLVDDNEIDNFINQKMIEGCHFSAHIYTYTSSKGALEFLGNLKKLRREKDALIPEIIFLDINMPIIDGFQFVEEFRKLPGYIKDIARIVILTSSIDPTDLQQSKSNDLIAHFASKPLSEVELEKIRL